MDKVVTDNIPADKQEGFWTSPGTETKELIENIDWVFLNDSNILVKTGKFEGISYRYNKVRLFEKEIDGNPAGVLEFDFTITSVHDDYSRQVTEAFEQRSDFQALAGDILCSLLESDEIRIGEEEPNGEIGRNDT